MSREANNRHLHTRHHRVEGINTVMIEIFGQNPDKSVQITEMVKSEKKFGDVDNALKCGRNPVSHMNFREIHASSIKRENFKSFKSSSGKYCFRTLCSPFCKIIRRILSWP